MKCDQRTQIIIEETTRGNVAVTIYIISAVLFVCWLVVQICAFNTYLINRGTLPLLGGRGATPTTDGILYLLIELVIIAVAGLVLICCSCCITEDMKNMRRRLAAYDRMIAATQKAEPDDKKTN